MGQSDRMRPILIGIDNPHSKDPAMALHPRPAGCSGWRLWRMLCDRLRVSEQQYLRAFDRRNLSDGERPILPGSTVVLLGEEVWRGVRVRYDIPRLLIHPQVRCGVTWRQVPHPSGRCLFYNDPAQRALVSLMLAELYEEGR